jgi:hypothetical protein
MATQRSRFEIEAKAVGFKETGAAAEKVGKVGRSAISGMLKEGKALRDVFRGLVQEQIRLNKEMSAAGRGTDAWKKVAAELRGVSKEAAGVLSLMSQIGEATKDQASKKGRFYKGLLQGLVPEINNIKEGPGMWRQALGAEIGKRSRGVGAGMANTFTHGIGGIAQALQSVPGGGFMSAPMMMAMGFAQQNLAYQGVQNQALPFLNVRGGGLSVSEAERRRYAAAWDPKRVAARETQAARMAQEKVAGIPDAEFLPGGKHAPDAWVTSELGGLEAAARKRWRHGPKGMWEEDAPPETRRDLANRRKMVAAGGRARLAEEQQGDIVTELRRQAMNKAGARPQTLRSLIAETGVDFGMAAPEALQMIAQVSQVGGGRGAALQAQGMVPAAMAAQTGYGIGAETSGAFLQAGRRGGLVGGLGDAGGALAGAIQDGLKLGLQGSELTDWVAKIGEGIQQWRQTGIPFNKDSTAALAGAVAGVGLGATRGAVVAQGLATAAQGLSQRGPSSPEELMMLQEVGGWKPGTGAAGFEAAQAQLEGGKGLTSEAVQRLMKRAMSAGGGGAGGRLVARRMLKQLGIQTGVEEMQGWGAQLEGGEMPAELKARIEQGRADQEAGAKEADQIRRLGLEEVVSRQVAGGTKQQAGLTNKEISIGGGMLKTMFNLEEGTHAMARSFEVLAGRGGPLEKLTDATRTLSSEMPKLAAKLRFLVAGEYGKLMVDGGE